MDDDGHVIWIVERGRRAVAEDGVIAIGENGGYQPSFVGDRLMAEQVDATEIAMKAARRDAVIDRARGKKR